MIQQVFGCEIQLKASVLKWYNCFNDGQKSPEPLTFHRTAIHEQKLERSAVSVCCAELRQWLSFRMIADHAGIDKMIVQVIIADDLQTKIICAKLERNLLRGQWLSGLNRHYNTFSDSLQFLSAPDRLFPFFLMNIAIKGYRHRSVAEVQAASNRSRKDIMGKNIESTFQACKVYWLMCVDTHGSYFEELQLFKSVSSIYFFSNLISSLFIETCSKCSISNK